MGGEASRRDYAGDTAARGDDHKKGYGITLARL